MSEEVLNEGQEVVAEAEAPVEEVPVTESEAPEAEVPASE